MLVLMLAYLSLAVAAIAGLSLTILSIGKALDDCPASNSAAKTAALSIVAGFVAIGAGAVLIVGAGSLALPGDLALPGMMGALGLAVLGLGLGFSQAVANLRDVVAQAALRAA